MTQPQGGKMKRNQQIKQFNFLENKSWLRLLSVSTLFIAPLFSPIAKSMSLGSLTIAGSGCFQKEDAKAEFSDQHLLVHIKTMAKKSIQDSIARGACQFALPIQLEKNERLVIKHSDLLGIMNVAAQSQIIIQSEVFFAGDKGVIIKKIEKTEDQRVKKSIFESSDEIIQSQCGESLILRGNSSLTLSGQKSRSTARLDQVNLIAEVESCEE